MPFLIAFLSDKLNCLKQPLLFNPFKFSFNMNLLIVIAIQLDKIKITFVTFVSKYSINGHINEQFVFPNTVPAGYDHQLIINSYLFLVLLAILILSISLVSFVTSKTYKILTVTQFSI